MLPPPRSKNAGALHPPTTRLLITPLPPRPPTMKPPLSTPGKTATASARSSRSPGIDFSRVPMICSKTRAALADWSAAARAFFVLRSRLDCAEAAEATPITKTEIVTRKTREIDLPIALSQRLCLDARLVSRPHQGGQVRPLNES